MAMNYPTWTQPSFTDRWTGGGVPGGDAGTGWLGDVGQTFMGDPSGLWQAGQLQRMSAAQLANPQWTNQAMTGFAPTYGQYMLGGGLVDGGAGTFGNWLGQNTPTSGAGMYGTSAGGLGGTPWSQAVAASQALTTPSTLTQLDPSQLGIQGFLQGENARRNALMMTQAAMGGGVGMGAMARQRALGSLYDVYAARTAGAGEPQGGFLSWIADRLKAPTTSTLSASATPITAPPEQPADVFIG